VKRHGSPRTRRAGLVAAIEAEGANASITERRIAALPQTAQNPQAWACKRAWFALTMGVFGIIFWLPQAIRNLSKLNDFSVAHVLSFTLVGGGMAMWF
jgi:hypothetical protein